jgi:hypothetical protein
MDLNGFDTNKMVAGEPPFDSCGASDEYEAGEYEFVVIELPRDKDGNCLVAASGAAETHEEAEREAMHYAAQYAQDGDIEVTVYRIHRERVSCVLMGPNVKVTGAARHEME